MPNQSGSLRIDDSGKIILSGEIFDDHGSYGFDGFVDTGCTDSIFLTQELADAVCAPAQETKKIGSGGGANSVEGHVSQANFRFGDLVLRDYKFTVVYKATRNLIGVKFFQDCGILLLADFHEGKTKGGLITSNRKIASAIGKTTHCLVSHNLDVTKCNEPCPICGTTGAMN